MATVAEKERTGCCILLWLFSFWFTLCAVHLSLSECCSSVFSVFEVILEAVSGFGAEMKVHTFLIGPKMLHFSRWCFVAEE